MRKIVVTEFLTLDGMMDNPAWTAPYWNDEIAAFKEAEQAACDTLLLGRVTYDGFAATWPQSTDEGADQMNGMPKYVVSGNLQEVTWNNSHLIRENVAGEVAKLKSQEGQDILVYGSGELARFLLQHGLVDQLNLLVFPVVLGRGKRLFDGEVPGLKLADSKTFSSGVVGLTYTLDAQQ